MDLLREVNVERAACSVSAKNCPGSKQDSLVSSGNGGSVSSGEEASVNVSSILKGHRERTGALTENGNVWEPKHRRAAVGLAGALGG